MPVIPQFEPGVSEQSILARSQDFAENLMSKAAARRRADEAAQIERTKFEIMRPVLESQMRVQLVSEANDLTAAHIINNSVATDLQRFPDYVKAWTDSAQLEDPKERLAERRRILGAITPFAAIKSTAPMVKAFQEQYAQDATADKTADVLAGRLDVTGAQNEAKAANADKQLEAKRIQLEAQQKQFELRQQHAKDLEALRAQHAQELEKTRGENRIANTTAGAGARQGTAKEMAANKINDAALHEGNTATVDLRDYETALQLLNDPKVRTGSFAEIETAAKRLGGIFGADMSGVKNLEQLQSLLGSSFLEKAKSLKGNFSDRDAATIQKLTPGIAKTNEGNIALLTLLIQKRARDVQIAKMVQAGRQEGASEREIQLEVNDFILQNPLELPTVQAPSAPLQIKSVKRIE